MRINITNSIQTGENGAQPQIQTVIQKGRGNSVGLMGGEQGNVGGITAKKCGSPAESPAGNGAPPAENAKAPEAAKGADAAQGAKGNDMQDLKALLGKALQMIKQLDENQCNPDAAKYLSASSAPMQPLPAAVTAWR